MVERCAVMLMLMLMLMQVNEIVSNWRSQTGDHQTSNKTQVAEYKSSFRKAQFFFFPGIVDQQQDSSTC